MRIFIALVFLLTSVNVNAAGGGFVYCPSTPAISKEANEACQAAYDAGVTECLKFAGVADQQGTAAVDSIRKQVQQQADAMKQGASAGAQSQTIGGVANSAISAACNASYQACYSKCKEAASQNMNAMSQVDTSDLECIKKYQTNEGIISDLQSNKCTQYKAIAAVTAPNAAQDLAAAGQSTTTEKAVEGTPHRSATAADKQVEIDAAKKAEEEGGWKKYAPWVVGAGMLGVGAMALFGNKGSGSGQQQNQQSSSNNSSSNQSSSTTTGAPCTQEANITDTSCSSTFVTQCSTDNSTTVCKKFTNYYCGFADDATSATSGTGEGMSSSNKTTFCRMNVSQRFCASGNTSCATCEYMTQLNKPICKTNLEQNPTLCSAQKSDTQIESQKSACPTDPVYAENGASSILQTVATGSTETPQIPTGATSNAANSTTTGTGSGTFTGKYYSSNASSKSTLTAASAKRTVAGYTGSTGISSGGVSIAAASTYKGAASEITATMGRNLFDKNSKMLQQWCYSVQCRNVRPSTQN